MDRLEPKSCPFCGGEALVIGGGAGNWFVRCSGCKATSDDRARDNAIAAWNRRSPDTRTEALVEALESLCNIMEHCSVTDGVCCCGDDMEKHASPMMCGHSPVDHGAYQATQAYEAARATLSLYRKKESPDGN